MSPWKPKVGSGEHSDPKSQRKDPRRRWLFVTGLPVTAGRLYVTAMMFNICALSSGWINIDDQHVTLSTWMAVLQAVSLTVAVSGYIAYLVLMRRYDGRVAVFWISVLGWLIAAALLFSIVGVVVQRHRHLPLQSRPEYTQAFYYGVFAAGLYALVALLLAVYVVGAPRIQLSRRDCRRVQRMNIILRSLCLATVLLVGAAIYRAVEGWSLLDALYFADFTILTIGIGNLVPHTHLGRSLLFPYATAGIITLGLMVSSVLSFTRDMREMKLHLQMAQMCDHWGKSATSEDRESPLPRASQVREMHHIKSQFRNSLYRKELIFFLLAWLVLWFLSAVVFRASEQQQGWSYFLALYFTYTSLTTIGYGDLYPTRSLGKVFFVFWSLLVLPILTNLVMAMGEFLHHVLVFCSTALWKNIVVVASVVYKPCLRFSHREQNHDSRQLPVQNSHSIPSLPDHDMESAGRLTLSASQSTQGDGVPQSLLRLLIVEEMAWLASMLRDSRCTEDLGVTRSRIVSLLHSGEQDVGPLDPAWLMTSSPASHHHHEQMIRSFLDRQHYVEDRNTEVVWMLTFLINKLRADLETDGR
ncbi:uncharacterized protein N7496_000163 [Penicillium cataractarum]|uniref:Potassium channel domain-containing protein n=1 Tax=Penicillium cataractarum TaxID=2100454 RepID=A0A9W9VTV5_9EURO|nr:uncharacterized protein N7496_000163 [Penicillium cataractarum]KAJ5389095.1 hypothetical protein N7496_000163 [Penicillium cataractarum]